MKQQKINKKIMDRWKRIREKRKRKLERQKIY